METELAPANQPLIPIAPEPQPFGQITHQDQPQSLRDAAQELIERRREQQSEARDLQGWDEVSQVQLRELPTPEEQQAILTARDGFDQALQQEQLQADRTNILAAMALIEIEDRFPETTMPGFDFNDWAIEDPVRLCSPKTAQRR